MSKFTWLVEAPGPRYLAVRKLAGYEFHWTDDANKALRFNDQEQADLTMMGIRELAPALFAFAALLGDPRPIEHGWVDR